MVGQGSGSRERLNPTTVTSTCFVWSVPRAGGHLDQLWSGFLGYWSGFFGVQVRIPWGTGQGSLGYRSGFFGSIAWSGFLEVLIRVPCGTGQDFLVTCQGSLGYWSEFLVLVRISWLLVRVPWGTGQGSLGY